MNRKVRKIFTMRLNSKVFSLSKLYWYWAIQKLHGSHHSWMSWPALDKGNLLKPSSASTRESENSWPGLWLLCLRRRLNWVEAETMRLSTHSVFCLNCVFTELADWANSAIELRCPSVCSWRHKTLSSNGCGDFGSKNVILI